MPEPVKAALEDAARANGRSLTSEIVSRLEASLLQVDTPRPSEETVSKVAEEAASNIIGALADIFVEFKPTQGSHFSDFLTEKMIEYAEARKNRQPVVLRERRPKKPDSPQDKG